MAVHLSRSRARVARVAGLLLAVLALFAALLPARASRATTTAQADEPRLARTQAPLLSVHGVIDPPTARYLERELRRAEAEGAPLVVVEVDTPGGLDASMRQMVQALLGARVPVVVYVSPAGARAASAGMFVTIAAGVAAMAPGTEIGAAHPVAIGGGASESTMETKVVNDASAFARAIAETRRRNAAWPERAVRDSVSITAEEAQREGVVDLVATDLPDLLQKIDGRSVATADGARTLHTAGIRTSERPMLATERALQIISDPNVAYLLFLFGLLGLFAELYHPGTFVPGTLGGIALVLALVAFGNLSISWAGVLLILIAVGLFVGELHTGVGALAVGALVALVVGSLLLYSPPGPASPTGPAMQVSPWLVAVMSSLVAGFFLVVVRATLRARRLAIRTGVAALVGQEGVATSELAPHGTVRVDSEVWSAESDGGPIHAGERVKVTAAAGVTLRVMSLGETSWKRLPSTSS